MLGILAALEDLGHHILKPRSLIADISFNLSDTDFIIFSVVFFLTTPWIY